VDTSEHSPQAKEAYREFLLTRGPSRVRMLGLVGVVASPLLFGLDLLSLSAASDTGLTLARVAHAALTRLPWVLVPLVSLLLMRRMLSLKALPQAAFWATALYAVGNDWAFYALGLAGSGYHVVMMFLNVITGPSLLPVSRWGRFAFYTLLAMAHLACDLLLADTRHLAARMVLNLILLMGASAVGWLMEALDKAQRRQFFLRQEVMQALLALEQSRAKIVETGRRWEARRRRCPRRYGAVAAVEQRAHGGGADCDGERADGELGGAAAAALALECDAGGGGAAVHGRGGRAHQRD
jgi:methyl-accepting chemotaxis protein